MPILVQPDDGLDFHCGCVVPFFVLPGPDHIVSLLIALLCSISQKVLFALRCSR